jgi:hypothetical protein
MNEGFEGKAGRVRINERLRGGRRVRDSAGLLQSAKLQTEIRSEERTLVRSRLKEKAVNVTNWNLFYLGGCVLLFVGVYLGRRYLGRLIDRL